jgi:hypothetical protein
LQEETKETQEIVMTDRELTQLILNSISKLEGKVDDLREEVASLRTESELIKRDKKWAQWIIGAVSSIFTFFLTTWFKGN